MAPRIFKGANPFLGSNPARKSQMAGCLTLLQSWGYEYFPKFRKGVNYEYDPETPRALLWNPSRFDSNVNEAQILVRSQLDNLEAVEVDWTPYDDSRRDFGTPVFQEDTIYRGCITVFDIVEPHLPDRVLRQFGYVQTVPRTPIHPVTRVNPRSNIKKFQSHRKFEWLQHEWDICQDFRLISRRLGKKASVPYEASFKYMPWFQRVSHLRVANPEYQVLGEIPKDPVKDQFACVMEVLDAVYEAGPSAGIDAIFGGVRRAYEIAHGIESGPSAIPSTVARLRPRKGKEKAK